MLTHHDPHSLHVYADHGRFYRVGGYQFPGVGTILNATDSAEQQQFWLNWRSHPENVECSDQAKLRGKLFHALVENHFKTGNYSTTSQVDNAIAQPFWESIQAVLPRITDIKLIESAVWHEVGHYAGTVDMVCNFDGVLCVLDWKTASRTKKPEWLAHYPLQLSAYCAAINRMYDVRIKHGIIVIALPKREAQVVHFALGRYWVIWLTRLVTYWEQQSTPLAAQALGRIHCEYGNLK